MFSAQDGIWDTVSGALSTMKPVQHILEDPALASITSRIAVLHGLEAKQVSKSSGGSIAESDVKGIGLGRLVPALDAYIFYRRNPWIIPAAAVGVWLLIKVLRR